MSKPPLHERKAIDDFLATVPTCSKGK